MHLISFSTSYYVILPLTGVIIYSFLFYKIIHLRPRTKANVWFLVYLFTCILSGIPDIFSISSPSPVDATYWTVIFMAINVLAVPPLLEFVLQYSGYINRMSTLLIQLGLFIPSIIVASLILFSNFIIPHSSADPHLVHFMWVFKYGTLYKPIYVAWIQVATIASAALLFKYARQVNDKIRKRQSFIFIASMITEVIVDISVFVIIPQVFKIYLFPDGLISSVLLGGIVSYGILKYNLFTVNSAIISSNIINTMYDLLIVINPAGYIELINPAITTNLNYSPEELIGKHLRILINNSWDYFEQSTVLPIVNGDNNSRSLQLFMIKKGGGQIPVNLSVSAIRDRSGILSGIVCVATDISQILQLENLTLQRNMLHGIIESLKDGILAFNSQGKVILYNANSLPFLSLEGKDIIGRPISEVFQLFEGQKVIDITQLINFSAGNKFLPIIEKHNVRLVNKLDEQFYVNVIITVISGTSESNLVGLITLQNLSKEKQLEGMKLDFVTMAAHELRTPLTSIRGYLSVFIQENSSKLNAEQNSFLNRISTSADKLTALVEDILNVSKVERGVLTVELVPVEWAPFVQRAMTNLSANARNKGIRLNFYQSPGDHPVVVVDKLRIEEVLNNIISNAIDYTNPGGLVEVSIETQSNQVVTHIKDTGIGIPADALPNLFTKFYRVSGSLDKGSRGTGLGLYISKQIIDGCHGKIWVDSEVGKGSIFSFALPTPSN